MNDPTVVLTTASAKLTEDHWHSREILFPHKNRPFFRDLSRISRGTTEHSRNLLACVKPLRFEVIYSKIITGLEISSIVETISSSRKKDVGERRISRVIRSRIAVLLSAQHPRNERAPKNGRWTPWKFLPWPARSVRQGVKVPNISVSLLAKCKETRETPFTSRSTKLLVSRCYVYERLDLFVGVLEIRITSNK
ncbi:hypothetical protein V1478_011419 [Vespula squamosa]|uniref:Uncharacterized protein n=1 Tax=Vespula squamosa TaxID=30214 RepID=A0ABD2AH19_VESSQ